MDCSASDEAGLAFCPFTTPVFVVFPRPQVSCVSLQQAKGLRLSINCKMTFFFLLHFNIFAIGMTLPLQKHVSLVVLLVAQLDISGRNVNSWWGPENASLTSDNINKAPTCDTTTRGGGHGFERNSEGDN